MAFLRLLGTKACPFVVARNFCSERSGWISVLDDPKIKSPFDNPRRTLSSPLPLQKIPVLLVKNNSQVSANDFGSSKGTLGDSDPKAFDSGNQFSSTPDQTINSSDISYSEGNASSSSNSSESNGFFRRISEKLGLYVDKSLSESEQKARRAARSVKLGCAFVLVGFVWFCISNGKQRRDENGQLIVDEYTGTWFAPFYRITNAMYFWKQYMTEPVRDKFLPDPVPPPYYHPKYTVVIEMKNVLVNPEWTYKTGYRFKKRPAVEYFLEVVGYPNFELVLYTSEPNMTAPAIVESLDPKHRIAYRLYKECTKFMDGHWVKDLSRLNRDLSKVIYIDFDPNSFKLNPENVLRVPKWEGDMNDTSLVDLAQLLRTIFMSDVDDVRPILQYYSQFDDPAAEFRRRAALLVEEDKQAKKEQSPDQLKRLTTGRLFGMGRHQIA